MYCRVGIAGGRVGTVREQFGRRAGGWADEGAAGERAGERVGDRVDG